MGTLTTATSWSPESGTDHALRRLGPAASEVLILPFRTDEAGRGVYWDTQLLTVKQLRAAGVDARFLHDDPSERVFQSEHSEELVAALAVGVASSAGWDCLKLIGEYVLAWGSQMTGGRSDARVRVAVARIERPDGAVIEGLEIEGPTAEAAARVVKELGKLLELPGDD